MPISPIGAGDPRPQEHDFTVDGGKLFSLLGISASAISYHLQDINHGNALYVCTGAYSIDGDGSAGVAHFTPSPQDLLPANPLGKPGFYWAYPVVALASGSVPMDAQTIQVVSLP